MTVGLVVLGVVPAATPLWVLSVLMILVGLGGPLVMPPVTAVLLDSVPEYRTGTASGVFNTSRQLGGALAVAVFGALLATPATFLRGAHTSLLIAARHPSHCGHVAADAPQLRTTERTTTMAQDKEPSGAQKAFGELKEVITHLAFYAGWVMTMSAMTVAKQVFQAG